MSERTISEAAVHEARRYARTSREQALDDLCELLRIPSESGDPAHHGDVRRAARWLESHLTGAGFDDVRVLETPGHPAVYGRAGAATDRPTLLLYGHYDVQPADPLDEWRTPPYEPTVVDGRLYARGASDDKGQAFALVTGVAAYLRTGAPPPVNVVVLLEGEEELSSPHLGGLLDEHRRLLSCDAVVIADQPMLDRHTPLVLYGVRGSVYLGVEVRGPSTDLHSGTFGGAVDNPANVLARIIASLQDPVTRRVLVPGFYDQVRDLDPVERAHLAGLPVTEELARALTGARDLAGEAGYPLVERLATRPTFDVHGMLAGHVTDGKKTVIPARAYAKLSSRLVPDQDPEDIVAKYRAHVASVAPSTVDVTVDVLGASRPAVMPRDSAINQAAARAYRLVLGHAPLFMRGGGSEPAVWELQRSLDAPVSMIGFGLPTDNIHAPNEHLTLDSFAAGIDTAIELLAAYAPAQSGGRVGPARSGPDPDRPGV